MTIPRKHCVIEGQGTLGTDSSISGVSTVSSKGSAVVERALGEDLAKRTRMVAREAWLVRIHQIGSTRGARGRVAVTGG